jgi:hypothetical protein
MNRTQVAVIDAVSLLQTERDELRELLRAVIAGVPEYAKHAAVHLPADVLAEIRARLN